MVAEEVGDRLWNPTHGLEPSPCMNPWNDAAAPGLEKLSICLTVFGVLHLHHTCCVSCRASCGVEVQPFRRCG